jgi:squalene-hopene/tetraprenyl-beta-curcumene cyclase
MLLARFGIRRKLDPLKKDVSNNFLRAQEPDGSWYGRWGTNYIYGTWSVLMALEEKG